MVEEEEKVVFVCELYKLRDEYRKCPDLSLRVQIQEDITLLQKALTTLENGMDPYPNRT
ncbi:hypothetical protein [Metaplanococcus flavidus]|uniref:Uncharacterized protein n=1 Tax=Metaplanococcus flavidus TaxID=569883 RepID=A0ABW3LDX9_9BACL